MYIGGYYWVFIFLYELLGDLVGFVLLMLFCYCYYFFKWGEVFLVYVFWYVCVWMVVEGMWIDSLMFGGFWVF